MEIKEYFKHDILLTSLCEAEECRQEDLKRQRRIFNKGWLMVPKGLSTKDLKDLQKETQANIDECLERNRTPGINEITKFYNDAWREDWIEKKKKIQSQLKFHESDGNGHLNIEKAKSYPIEQLIDFNSGGFASCPFHGPEKTNSAKLYKERNKIHCFGCGIDADSIDVAQKLFNLTFNEAIRKLS